MALTMEWKRRVEKWKGCGKRTVVRRQDNS